MRTKTLIGLATLVASAFVATAQTPVYSLNVVGYVNVPVAGSAAGEFTMIANPLDATANTLEALIPTAPEFTQVYKFTGGQFDISTFFLGSWDKPATTLNPGEGAIVQSTEAFTTTFVGEVLQGELSNPYPAGLSIRASQVPQAGTLTQLGLPGSQFSDFDQVFTWNSTTKSYNVYTYFLGAWDTEPSLKVGESMWLQTANAGAWVRTFNVQ